MNEAIDLYGENTDLATITPLDTIFASYRKSRKAIEQISAYVSDNGSEMHYFLEGARVKKRFGSYSARELFKTDLAIPALDAEYWQKVMAYTDVLESMPAKMRNEWSAQIMEHKTPAFERDTVHATMNDLLLKRSEFFSKRVDGIFRALSSEHVTNQPQGFGKRMIINRMLTYYRSVDHDTTNYLHDLRVVIGKFMGREVPNSSDTYRDMHRIYDSQLFGEWHTFDGGALRIKLFKKGTAHMEVHPQLAWRLNRVLANLYPMAIPASFRKKPNKIKVHPIADTLLSFETIHALDCLKKQSESCVWLSGNLSDGTREVLEHLGGEVVMGGNWEFGYPVMDVINEVMRSGMLPEKKSHQYYNTNETLARHVIDLADIEDDHSILEPSVGTGGIADYLPKEQTICIDVARLYCKIMKEKGFETIHADFLSWRCDQKFDRIVMNPPFSNRRAEEHLRKAHSLLKDDGKLVAILPGSMKGNTYFENWDHEWSETLENEFKESGTGVYVAILSLTRKN